MFRKSDILIISIIFVLSFLLLLIVYLKPFEGVPVVNVYIDNNKIDSFLLEGEYQQIPIQTSYGYNLLIISENMAFIDESDCNTQSCVSRNVISRPGSMIICAPDHLIIKIETIKAG